MNTIQLDITNARLSAKEYRSCTEMLRDELTDLHYVARKQDYIDPRSSINLAFDKPNLQRIKKLAKFYGDIDLLVVCGIGGSNLGTTAIYQALTSTIHARAKTGRKKPTLPQVIFADTVDSYATTRAIDEVTRALLTRKKILVNVITKSGATTETLAHLNVYADLLKKYLQNWNECIVVTTDRDSPLWRIAEQQDIQCLEIPKQVGGRYSVLSAVGLFPLALLGADIDALLNGAKVSRKSCLTKIVHNNIAVQLATTVYLHSRQGRSVHDLFLFSTDLEGIGKWYRQLLAESIGKEFDRDGKRVRCGILPTVSIGSTDLHSMAQLYLGGPDNRHTTFVRVVDAPIVKTPTVKEFSSLGMVQNKTFATIMNAILTGTQTAFANDKRPFTTLTLPALDACAIGGLIQLLEIHVMLLGALFDVNAYDQPAVEKYKVETTRLLK